MSSVKLYYLPSGVTQWEPVGSLDLAEIRTSEHLIRILKESVQSNTPLFSYYEAAFVDFTESTSLDVLRKNPNLYIADSGPFVVKSNPPSAWKFTPNSLSVSAFSSASPSSQTVTPSYSANSPAPVVSHYSTPIKNSAAAAGSVAMTPTNNFVSVSSPPISTTTGAGFGSVPPLTSPIHSNLPFAPAISSPNHNTASFSNTFASSNNFSPSLLSGHVSSTTQSTASPVFHSNPHISSPLPLLQIPHAPALPIATVTAPPVLTMPLPMKPTKICSQMDCKDTSSAHFSAFAHVNPSAPNCKDGVNCALLHRRDVEHLVRAKHPCGYGTMCPNLTEQDSRFHQALWTHADPAPYTL